MFRIAEAVEFRERLSDVRAAEQRRIRKKLTEYIYPILRANPISGPNIKRLSNYSPPTWRYRMGAYRLFYEIHGGTVFITTIQRRRDAYR